MNKEWIKQNCTDEEIEEMYKKLFIESSVDLIAADKKNGLYPCDVIIWPLYKQKKREMNTTDFEKQDEATSAAKNKTFELAEVGTVSVRWSWGWKKNTAQWRVYVENEECDESFTFRYPYTEKYSGKP